MVRLISIFIISIFLSKVSVGQSTLSVYSALGIGDLSSLSLTHNQGMGGIGISNPSVWYLNNMNPALLPYNSLTVFEAAIVGDFKKVSTNLLSENNSNFNFSYLVTAFPIKPGKWTVSLGLKPYSRVHYNFNATGTIGTTNIQTIINDKGSGGFNQFYLGNGFMINDNLSVGIKTTYLFSSIIKETSTAIIDSAVVSTIIPNLFNRISVSDFKFEGGIAYSKTLNSKLKLKLGLVYDLKAKIKAKKLQSIELQNQFGIVSQTDTIENVKGNIELPSGLQFGLSLNNGIKWTAGIEARVQDWSKYKSIENSNEGLDRSFGISIGGEVVPNPSALDNYLARITYRVGFNYDKTPYVYKGKQIDEIGINFGWSLPVSRISSIDLAFKFGRRGSKDNGLVKEEFFKFYFGITFNDRWFVQRRYN